MSKRTLRIALFGATGQVGRETVRAAKARGVALLPIAREDADLATPGAAARALEALRPEAVINAAAWTAVDRAESEKEAAFRLNAGATEEIARAASSIGARLVHLSTDYVFDGTASAPIKEGAATAPRNVYGASKLEGERRVRAAHGNAVILRTSWIFSRHGSNFVRTMLRLAASKDEVDIVADQTGGPTPASAIAGACLRIAAQEDGPGGLYHFQGAPPASWAEFAEAIFLAAERTVRVRRIDQAAFAAPASRPLYTVLDCSKIAADYGLSQPDWRADLVMTVKALQNAAEASRAPRQ